ncbi:MAG: carbohydrate binding domain-containing protein [Protaetiibacter sp.]
MRTRGGRHGTVMSDHRRLLALVVAAACAVGVIIGTSDEPAEAAVASNFDAGYIISDETMYSSREMTAAQVDAFLDAKGASCTANGTISCVKDVLISYSAQAVNAYCSAMSAATNATAGQMIVAVAVACGINPQVLLVLIEKEQSLVSRTTPTSYSYRYATGFACPDSSGCSDEKAGFFVQVYSAAKQFRIYAAKPSSFNYLAGQYNSILYNPNTQCGSSSVYIRNQATASLYNYTPYQPNAAALANMYGTGDSCSSYGNRNFWRIFSDWFGNPANLLDNGSFENNTTSWDFRGNIDRQVITTSTADAGNSAMRLRANTAGSSLQQSVTRSVVVGESYDAEIAVRTIVAGTTASIRIAVWGLGGTNENAVTSVSVGGEWTEVETDLLVQKAGHVQVRIEVYVDTPGVLIEVDDARIVRTASQDLRAAVTMSSPSFEQGDGGWAPGNGFINWVFYDGGAPDGGSKYLASNTTVSGRSVAQSVTWDVASSGSYTARVWLRSASGTPFTGVFALWALGGTTQSASTPFTVGADWTQFSVTLPVTTTNNTILKLEIYLGTTGSTLYMDNASIQPNLAENASFESGVTPWTFAQTGTNLVSYAGGSGQYVPVDGKRIGATNVSQANASIYIDTARFLREGEEYTASLWVRSASAGTTGSVTLALWALGGDESINATTSATVGDSWQQLTVSLPVTVEAASQLRLELYQATTGFTIFVDGAELY